MNDNEFLKEQQNLEKTVDEYKEVISDTKLKIKNLPALYPDKDFRLAEQERLLRRIDKLETSLKKPYFARIDFYNDKSSLKDICYIGKIGVTNYDNEVITVDWRAPISSLYYDSNIGKTSYIAPEGIINGELQLKRQYDIENSTLNSFNDVDTVSNDEILKPYLSASADKRLKNIVASIQSEQNAIIRESISKNSIIQGVAGSGKTTVALHHIAYLVYNNRDYYDANQYMVIGPNKFFVDYISSVLPELDVDGVKQFDFTGFASHYLNIDFEIKNSLDNFNNFKNKEDNFSYYRTSLELQKFIKDYMKRFEDNMLPKTDLEYKNIKFLSQKEIAKEYYEINKKTSDTISKRIDRAILLLSKKIDERKNIILNKSLKSVIDEKNIIKQKEYAKDNQLLKKELESSGTNILKRYFKKIKFNIYDIYKDILLKVKEEHKFESEIEIKIKEIKKGILEFEDLTPLMYIKYIINGAEDYKRYRHIVIDEAQDYNLFTFYILRKILSDSTFSIYGDLAQSLYSNRSISSWEDVVQKVFLGKMSIQYLNKSYRTTIEIMNEANKINKHLSYTLAQPVIRHGSDVKYVDTSKINIIDSILKEIEYMKENDCKTIAIIGKTLGEVEQIYNDIKSKINVEKITSKNNNFSNDICITTGYLSKGLEFDGVIICNVTDDNYDVESNLDMKLLYVSTTRALHEISILYNKSLLSVLRKENENEKR